MRESDLHGKALVVAVAESTRWRRGGRFYKNKKVSSGFCGVCGQSQPFVFFFLGCFC